MCILFFNDLFIHNAFWIKLIRLLTSCTLYAHIRQPWDPETSDAFQQVTSEPTTTWSGTSVALSKHILSRTDTSRQCQRRDPINLCDGTLSVNEWLYKARKLQISSIRTYLKVMNIIRWMGRWWCKSIKLYNRVLDCVCLGMVKIVLSAIADFL